MARTVLNKRADMVGENANNEQPLYELNDLLVLSGIT